VDAINAGLIAVALGQIATLATIIVNGALTRSREHAKAKRDDDIAERNRRWLIEDRAALAATLQAKVEATAATVAATAELTAHKLALKVAEDQRLAAAHVETITAALAENTRLTVGVGERAEAAYQEANSVNLKIAEIARTAASPLADHLRDTAAAIEQHETRFKP